MLRFADTEWLRPSLVAALPLSLLLLVLFWRDAERSLFNRYTAALALLLALNVVSHETDADIFPGADGLGHYFNYLTLAGTFLTFWTGQVVALDPARRRAALTGLLAGSAIQIFAVLALPDHLVNAYIVRKTGLLSDPNIAVFYFLPAYTLALALGINRRHRNWLLLGLIPVSAAVLLTISRMGLIALLTSSLVLLFFLLRERARRVTAAAVLTGIAAVTLVVAGLDVPFTERLDRVIDSYRQRLDTRAGYTDVARTRMIWWEEARSHNLLSADRLLGTGYHVGANLPHNTFADQYFATGLPGVVIFATLFITILAGHFRAYFRSPSEGAGWQHAAYACGLVALGMTLLALSQLNARPLWFILGYTAGCLPRRSAGVLMPRAAYGAGWHPDARRPDGVPLSL